MTSGKILAIAGTVASVLSMCGGLVAQWWPSAGVLMLGSSGAVMLLGNVLALAIGKG